MSLTEASRQYQQALEHRRSLRLLAAGQVGFDEELRDADREVEDAEARVMSELWDRADD